MSIIQWVLLGLVVVHGLIHLMGFVKAFGLAELPQLTQPVSRPLGALWLLATLAFAAAAVALLAQPRLFWGVGLAAILLSQGLVFTAWRDAKAGTLANALIGLAVLYSFGATGPWSLTADFERDVAAGLAKLPPTPPEPVTEADLAPLPAPLQTYIRRSGALGQPRVRSFEARWDGRIRPGPDEPWMTFTATQVNFVDEPARFFLMDATKVGLPVDVLHAFKHAEASMTVRLVSLIQLFTVSGPTVTRAETVTLFNDLCVLAPAALIDPSIRWDSVDDHRARGAFTIGPNTVSAELIFNDEGDLVDFVSDDRLMVPQDGGEPVRLRWSTPVTDYRDFGPWRAFSRGEARWHPPEGAYTYLEAELVDLRINEVSARAP